MIEKILEKINTNDDIKTERSNKAIEPSGIKSPLSFRGSSSNFLTHAPATTRITSNKLFNKTARMKITNKNQEHDIDSSSKTITTIKLPKKVFDKSGVKTTIVCGAHASARGERDLQLQSYLQSRQILKM